MDIEEQIAELEQVQIKAARGLAEGGLKEAQAITLEDFLTPAQIKACLKLAGLALVGGAPVRRGKALEDKALTKAIEEQVIKTDMAEINRKLGQENDATYLAYAVTYVVGELRRRAQPR